MIFSGAMRKLNTGDVQQSLLVMENHIRSMQEQLEYTLYNLDSTNITSLDTGMTGITSQGGGINISGESISLTGPQGEKAVIGDQGGRFMLTLAGRGGVPAIYLDGQGRIAVGAQADVTVDGGRWDQ